MVLTGCVFFDNTRKKNLNKSSLLFEDFLVLESKVFYLMTQGAKTKSLWKCGYFEIKESVLMYLRLHGDVPHGDRR